MNTIAQGTTPTLPFKYALDWEDTNLVWISFRQNRDEVLTIKEKNRFSFEDNIIKITLTQEETFLFKKGPAKVELRVQIGSTWLKSDKMPFYVESSINKEVM